MADRGQPLLPLYGPGWRECTYLCASCEQAGVFSEQQVTFPPDAVPPATLRLPCFGAALDAGTGLEHIPQHLYKLGWDRKAPPEQ